MAGNGSIKRKWPGTQYKRRQDKRRAALVADRLLGRKNVPPEHDELIDTMAGAAWYKHSSNLLSTNPRSHIYLKGITT